MGHADTSHSLEGSGCRHVEPRGRSLLGRGKLVAGDRGSTALAVGAVCYGLCLVLHIAATQHLGAARAQTIFGTSPFWGVVMSWIVLAEPLTVAQVAAGQFGITQFCRGQPRLTRLDARRVEESSRTDPPTDADEIVLLGAEAVRAIVGAFRGSRGARARRALRSSTDHGRPASKHDGGCGPST
jgi:hypothetical protein